MARELPKNWWGLLRQTYMEWSEDRASTLAAALSYSAIFALAPIVVIAVYVTGLVLGHHSGARRAVHDQIAGFVGEGSAVFFDQVISKTYQASIGGKAVVFSVVSGILLLYAATNLFTSLQDSLNVVWHVERNPKMGWRAMVWARFVTFVMVVAIGVLLLLSVVASTYVASVGQFLGGMSPLLAAGFEAVLSVVVFTVLFAMMMKYLPDAVVNWPDVLVGAAFTAILFTVGKYGLAMYLSRASVSTTYGAAGSLVVLMLFIYYSAQIFFLGAEFTTVYARRTGTPIRPRKYAVHVEEARRMQEESKVAKGLMAKEGTGEADKVKG